MYSFPNLEPVLCPSLTVASWLAYRFLRRQVRWSSIPISWRIFQFVAIYTVKGFSIVNETEVDVFLEFTCFFYDPTDVGNLISGLIPLPFLNPACTSGSSQFTYYWSLAWRIFSFTLLACEMSAIVLVWTFFGIALLWDWKENWPFPVLLWLLSFPNLLAHWV